MNYTTDGGTTWHNVPLPTNTAGGYTTVFGVETPHQMFFDATGALNVVYFSQRSGGSTDKAELNLARIQRTLYPAIPTAQRWTIGKVDTAGLGTGRYVAAVATQTELAVVYFPGKKWKSASSNPFTIPQYVTVPWTATDPSTQTARGFLGADPLAPGGLQTNNERIWAATDGHHLFIVSARSIVGNITEQSVHKLTFTNGALVNNGPVGNGTNGSFTDLSTLPYTDLTPYLGDMSNLSSNVAGPVLGAAAPLVGSPSLSKGVRINVLPPDNQGMADTKNYWVVSVGPNGNVTRSGPKNDITNPPPGVIQQIGEGTGWDHSITAVHGQVAYCWCMNHISGTVTQYHVTDISSQ
ncbi:MAG: hypothetical protein JNJ88_00870 [Planctomycetes bacterium]|nr:hypothetical protein [Planctomycetota bacterium]